MLFFLICREFAKHVSTADDCRSFPDFFRSLVTAWKLKEVIAVDNVWYATEDRDKLVNILGEHIFNNIVRIGNNYYQQERGKWDIVDIKLSRNFSFQKFFLKSVKLANVWLDERAVRALEIVWVSCNRYCCENS